MHLLRMKKTAPIPAVSQNYSAQDYKAQGWVSKTPTRIGGSLEKKVILAQKKLVTAYLARIEAIDKAGP